MRRHILSVLLLALTPALLTAQNDDGVGPVFFFGGGGTFTTNRLSDYVKPGYHFTGGAGIRAIRGIEFLGEFSLHDLAVEESVLTQMQVPGGDARVVSLTGNVKIPFATGRVRPYVVAGGGWYRRTIDFTEPATGLVTVYDPWWGWVGDVAVPTNRLLGSVSRNAGGINGGAGVSFDVGTGTHLFVQARWHRAFHNPTNTTLVPITVGLSF